MTVRLLHRAENGKLLLFFNGWSMDDTLFEGWKNPGFNVMTVHDYTAPEALPEEEPPQPVSRPAAQAPAAARPLAFRN